jgi:hypothetical protein
MTMKNLDSIPITLPEYANNPFITALPPLLSKLEQLEALAVKPMYDAKERLYPAHLRKHCLLRLGRYFEPLERQLQLAERFGILLRQGYIGRNPNTPSYIHRLQNGVDTINAKSVYIEARQPIANTANSFALVGCSGNGKSTATEQILIQQPQCIQHSSPVSLIQIVWLKLECPSQGSTRQLCINFFSTIDRLIGTNYLAQYGKAKNGVDVMMAHMAHVANLHAIGVLVIDEIQHLRTSKIGSEGILNFLVTLVNSIGIPVILIGTLSAIPILQTNFRQARRASGLGSLTWDAMPNNKSWGYFINKMWAYQWTRDFTPMTAEIELVLYEESQGIIDIAVKLFMLTQLRIISIREVKEGSEVITPALIHRVAREDLRIVQPMLNALRAGDKKALEKYDDLKPLQDYVDEVFNSATYQPGVVTQAVESSTSHPNESDDVVPTDSLSSLRAALSKLNISSDIAEVLVQEALIKIPSADPLLMMSFISEKLTSVPKSKPAKSPRLKVTEDNVLQLPEKDLRKILAMAKNSNMGAYNALLGAEIIKHPMSDIAA